MYKKSGKNGRRPLWINKKILVILQKTKKAYGGWKQGWVSWKGYRNIIQVCKDEIGKGKSQLELNLSRDVKDSKKGFCKYRGEERKATENVGPLQN